MDKKIGYGKYRTEKEEFEKREFPVFGFQKACKFFAGHYDYISESGQQGTGEGRKPSANKRI